MCSLNAFTHSVHCRKIASTPNVETTATTTATGSPARPPPPPPPPPSPPDHQQRRRPRAAQAAVLGTYFEIRLSIYIFRTAKLCTRLARRGGLVLGVGGGGGLCVGLNQPNISMVSALPLCATQSVLFRPNPGTSTRRANVYIFIQNSVPVSVSKGCLPLSLSLSLSHRSPGERAH